jgi:hypothetical protein
MLEGLGAADSAARVKLQAAPKQVEQVGLPGEQLPEGLHAGHPLEAAGRAPSTDPAVLEGVPEL